MEAAKVYINKSPHRQHGQVLEFVTKKRVKLLNLTNPEIVSTLGDQDAFIIQDGKVRRNSEYRKDYRLCQKLCKSEVDGFYYMPSDTRRFWENESRPDDVLRRVGIWPDLSRRIHDAIEAWKLAAAEHAQKNYEKKKVEYK